MPVFNTTIFNEDIFAEGNPNAYDKVYNVVGFNDEIFNTTAPTPGSGRGGIAKLFNVGYNTGTGFNDRVYSSSVDGGQIYNSTIFNNTMFNANPPTVGGDTITNYYSSGRTLNKIRTMDR